MKVFWFFFSKKNGRSARGWRGGRAQEKALLFNKKKQKFPFIVLVPHFPAQ
jgi:hypothetical protein